MMRNGFSILEAMVVLGIIAIVAAIGVAGYRIYVESVQDEATIGNLNIATRAITTDYLILSEDIPAGSDLLGIGGVDAPCRRHANEVVRYLNDVKAHKNQFRTECPLAFNGNRAVKGDTTAYITSECPVPKSGNNVLVPRGSIMVACTSNNVTLTNDKFKLYTCACINERECETTDVDDACSGDPACLKTWMDDNPEGCASPPNY